jgi:transcriptional regulator with XRE-family HTH domain
MERGISQYRLCQLTGLGADTVCRLVHDIRTPTESQALRICLGLGLDNKDANRLLEAADFYPLPDLGHYRPTGRLGWPSGESRVHVGTASITAPGAGG